MRVRRQVPQTVAAQVEGDELVLPVKLVRPAQSWADDAVRSEAKRRWFRDHGIDPADWSAVHPILVRSGTIHGYPLALERARIRAEGKGTIRRALDRL